MGVFFDGIVQMNHITGACQQEISGIPPLQIAVFDTGGTVDTLRFHARTDLERLNRENEPLIREALAMLSRADAVSVGKAASLSAMANQAILYKATATENPCGRFRTWRRRRQCRPQWNSTWTAFCAGFFVRSADKSGQGNASPFPAFNLLAYSSSGCRRL